MNFFKVTHNLDKVDWPVASQGPRYLDLWPVSFSVLKEFNEVADCLMRKCLNVLVDFP